MGLDQRLNDALAELREQGLYKPERVITTPQGAHVKVADGSEVLNFCANNYLGLANHPDIVAAAKAALDDHGFGMASVRFICGTQDLHKKLEAQIAEFVGTESAITYSSCFDANGGLFETLLDEQDAVISDALNHASIIDGIRLCKAKRYRYAHADMFDLEDKLRQSASARTRIIATDGVFSMDGDIAPLAEIVALAERYDALVMVDDCHASGFVGAGGRGSAELHDVMGRVHIITSTLGKALGGASGGFVAASAAVVETLRQRSRPYLFSNTIAPPIAAASLVALSLIRNSTTLRETLTRNTRRFRDALTGAGFTIKAGEHPIVPVMLGDASLAQNMAEDLLREGVYVVGFSYPVVPKGQARIRVQLSAAHSSDDVERAIAAFTAIGRRHGVIASH